MKTTKQVTVQPTTDDLIDQNCYPVERFEQRNQLEAFIKMLNKEPNKNELGKTADGKASTIPISFIEMTLDETFKGLWSTENFTYQVFANEVVGSLELVAIHPVNGMQIRRTGAASIQIMVNKGTNPLDINNKKSNALDMGFPRLKSECLKNAAQSLGKIFGRDLNRDKSDVFKSTPPIDDKAFADALERYLSGENIIKSLLMQNFNLTDDQYNTLMLSTPRQLTNGAH